jgi:O-succinylbenzoic acid--CoA ligase
MRDWLAAAAQRRPHHPFVVTPSGSASFAEVEEQVRRAVGALGREGVGEGRRVAVWAANDLPSVVALMAVPRVGATTVLLDPRLTAEEAGRRAARAGAGWVVGAGPDLGVPVLDPSEGPSAPGVAPSPGRLHTIAFTSGSSGEPKGVRLTWGNLAASARAGALHLGHRADDRWLAVLPVHHLGGLMILVRSADQASTVLLEPRFDPSRAAGLLRAGEATVASLVAVMLQRILEADPGPYRAVRAVLVGGGPVPADLLARATAGGLPVLASYGMTETASQVATARVEDPGRPLVLPGVEIAAIDGRLWVRGPMVSPGYLDEPDRGSEEWFDTGDAGEVEADGGIRVHGRVDGTIVTGGENLHPEEVEAVLRGFPGLMDVVVVGVPDPVWGALVAAVYEGGVPPEALAAYARARLAGFKVPRRWAAVAALPRLATGKVDRRAAARIAAGAA